MDQTCGAVGVMVCVEGMQHAWSKGRGGCLPLHASRLAEWQLRRLLLLPSTPHKHRACTLHLEELFLESTTVNMQFRDLDQR